MTATRPLSTGLLGLRCSDALIFGPQSLAALDRALRGEGFPCASGIPAAEEIYLKHPPQRGGA